MGGLEGKDLARSAAQLQEALTVEITEGMVMTLVRAH